MKRELICSVILCLLNLVDTSSAEVSFEWGRLTDNKGNDYIVYVKTDGTEISDRALNPFVDDTSVYRLYVEDGNGNPVESSLGEKILVDLQMYFKLRNFDIFAFDENNKNRPINDTHIGASGSFRFDDGNEFFVMLPASDIDDINNDVLLEGSLLRDGLYESEKRREVWKQVFLTTIFQKELLSSEILSSDPVRELAELSNRLNQYLSGALLVGGKTAKFAEAMLKGKEIIIGQDIAQSDDLIEVFLDIAEVSKIEQARDKLSKLGDALGDALALLGVGQRISYDVMEGLMLRSLATADAQARLDALERLVLNGSLAEKDSEILNGFLDAREVFAAIDASTWEGIKEEIINQGTIPRTLFDLGQLVAPKIAEKVLHLTGHKLAFASSVIGSVSAFASTVWAIDDKFDALRMGALAATLEYYIADELHNSEITPVVEEIEYHQQLQICSYFLGFYYFDNMRRVLINDWWDPLALFDLFSWFRGVGPSDVVEFVDPQIQRNISFYRTRQIGNYEREWLRSKLSMTQDRYQVDILYPTADYPALVPYDMTFDLDIALNIQKNGAVPPVLNASDLTVLVGKDQVEIVEIQADDSYYRLRLKLLAFDQTEAFRDLSVSLVEGEGGFGLARQEDAIQYSPYQSPGLIAGKLVDIGHRLKSFDQYYFKVYWSEAVDEIYEGAITEDGRFYIDLSQPTRKIAKPAKKEDVTTAELQKIEMIDRSTDQVVAHWEYTSDMFSRDFFLKKPLPIIGALNEEQFKHAFHYVLIHTDKPQLYGTEKRKGWEYYQPEEYQVTVIQRPQGMPYFSDIEPTYIPVVFIHGLNGKIGYWGYTDDVHMEGRNVWELYYPGDQPVRESGKLIGSTLAWLREEFYRFDTRTALVAHSMGGLVSRSYLQGGSYADDVSSLLMLGTPNFGALNAYILRHVTGGDRVGKTLGRDPYAPAYEDLSLGSELIWELNYTPELPILPGGYLVVAGVAERLWPFISPEAPPMSDIRMDSHDDGLVSVSSASLLNFSQPLAIINLDHAQLKGTRGVVADPPFGADAFRDVVIDRMKDLIEGFEGQGLEGVEPLTASDLLLISSANDPDLSRQEDFPWVDLRRGGLLINRTLVTERSLEGGMSLQPIPQDVFGVSDMLLENPLSNCWSYWDIQLQNSLLEVIGGKGWGPGGAIPARTYSVLDGRSREELLQLEVKPLQTVLYPTSSSLISLEILTPTTDRPQFVAISSSPDVLEHDKIQILVRVRDAEGRFIPGLQEQDFKLTLSNASLSTMDFTEQAGESTYLLEARVPRRADESLLALSVTVRYEGLSTYAIENNAVAYINRPVIFRALSWLRQNQRADGRWWYNGNKYQDIAATALATQAFLASGVDDSDTTVARAIDYIRSSLAESGAFNHSSMTYFGSMSAVALASADKTNEIPRYTSTIDSIISHLTKNSAGLNAVGWTYQGNASASGDMSNSQWAFLALNEVGYDENNIWQKIGNYVKSRQHSNLGIIGYSSAASTPDLTNTCGGIWGYRMAINRGHIFSTEQQKALNWVMQNYSLDDLVAGRGLRNNYYYYYIYTFAKAMAISGQKRIDGKDWYLALNRYLTDLREEEGYWKKQAMSDDISTAMAVLSLQTGTVPPNSAVKIALNLLNNPATKPAQTGPEFTADLHVYDRSGNHVGKLDTGEIEVGIPGANWEVVGGTQTVYLALAMTAEDYSVEVHNRSSEQVDYQLEVETFQEEKRVAQQIFTGEVEQGEVEGANILTNAIGGLSAFISEPQVLPVMQLPDEFIWGTPTAGDTMSAEIIIRETSGETGFGHLNIYAEEMIDVVGRVVTAEQFTVTPASLDTLVPGGTDTISIQLAVPMDIEITPLPYIGRLVVDPLSGKGRRSTLLRLKGVDTPPQAIFSTDSTDFELNMGTVFVNETKRQEIRVHNLGGRTLEIWEAKLSELTKMQRDGIEFRIEVAPDTIATGESASIIMALSVSRDTDLPMYEQFDIDGDLVIRTNADPFNIKLAATVVKPVFNIAGKVRYYNGGKPVENTRLTLSDDEDGVLTNRDGQYRFTGVSWGTPVRLRPQRRSTPADYRAVDNADVDRILRFNALLLHPGLEEIRACDVSGWEGERDGRCSLDDAAWILRSILLGEDFSEDKSVGKWVFLPETVDTVVTSQIEVDFIAYLLGDANGDWSSESRVEKKENLGELADFRLSDAEGRTGGEIRSQLRLNTRWSNLSSLFLVLDYDDRLLEFDSAGSLRPDEYEIVENGSVPGKLLLAVSAQGHLYSEDPFAELKFRIKKFTEVQTVLSDIGKEPILSEIRITKAFVGDEELSPNGVAKLLIQAVPDEWELHPNLPNPFNAETLIRLSVPERASVSLVVYNILGQRIRSLLKGVVMEPGFYEQRWDGTDDSGQRVASGVYVMQLEVPNVQFIQKMTLIR